MRILIIVLVLTFSLASCLHINEKETQMAKFLGCTIDLNNFNSIKKDDASYIFADLQNRYDYFSLIYLQNECGPCYERYIEWHQKMNSIQSPKNHTVIFIIQGLYANDFIEEIDKIEHVDHRYYMIMDDNFRFLNSNPSIPKWIIDQSLLVDKENRIRMIGAPFWSKKLEKKFVQICGK